MIRFPNFYRGLVLGAGLMYLLDPSRGRTRRARLRDRITGALADSREFLDDALRTGGTTAGSESVPRPDQASDEAIVARVRAKLGRYVAHPRAVSVEARDGSVTLSGRIHRGEAESLIGAVSSVRGVREVLNRLEPHDPDDKVPELQGTSQGSRPRLFDSTPAMPAGLQLLAGVLGATAVAYGAGRIVARVRAARFDELEREMPEYAMLR